MTNGFAYILNLTIAGCAGSSVTVNVCFLAENHSFDRETVQREGAGRIASS